MLARVAVWMIMGKTSAGGMTVLDEGAILRRLQNHCSSYPGYNTIKCCRISHVVDLVDWFAIWRVGRRDA